MGYSPWARIELSNSLMTERVNNSNNNTHVSSVWVKNRLWGQTSPVSILHLSTSVKSLKLLSLGSLPVKTIFRALLGLQ